MFCRLSKIVAFASVLAASPALLAVDAGADSALWWMVGEWGGEGPSKITNAWGAQMEVSDFVSAEGYQANAARVFAVDANGNATALHFYYQDPDNYNAWTLNGTDAWLRDEDGNWSGMEWTPADLSVLGGDLNSYKFYIELANLVEGAEGASDTWTVLGHSYQDSYGNLLNDGFISTGLVTPQPHIPWTPNFVVPEPSSGLLLVFGGALLALRRRRKSPNGKGASSASSAVGAKCERH